jgi:hypothetical protein
MPYRAQFSQDHGTTHDATPAEYNRLSPFLEPIGPDASGFNGPIIAAKNRTFARKPRTQFIAKFVRGLSAARQRHPRQRLDLLRHRSLWRHQIPRRNHVSWIRARRPASDPHELITRWTPAVPRNRAPASGQLKLLVAAEKPSRRSQKLNFIHRKPEQRRRKRKQQWKHRQAQA